MQAFVWCASFETGIIEVDDQHKRLIELTNTLGTELTESGMQSERMEEVLTDLISYARQHFEDEEKLMVAKHVDRRHIDKHVKEHNSFLEYVLMLTGEQMKQGDKSGQKVFEFLTHWLAFHILGSDQIMAKQMGQIEKGADPIQAYMVMEKQAIISTEPLLAALNTLFEQVLMSNKELNYLNKNLEIQVAERTKELQKANEDLEILALTDALTELPNRRHAMRVLHQLWQESEEFNLPLSCIMLDADNFKSVNDTYGHEAGDKVLVCLSKELRHAVRSDDLVCRLGGDEFLIICPATPLDGAMFVAKNVLKVVSALKVAVGDGFWFGSMSIGVADKRTGMNELDELLKVADEGVYKAKSDGKKCVRTTQKDA